MRLNLLNISRRTATLGFIVLFPGFLLYHYSIAQGWIPAFLGGLFGAAAAALAVAAIALSPWLAGATANGAAMPAAMTCLTIGYVALWATANYMTGSDLYSRDAAVETFSALAGWIALLFVGGCFAFDSRRTKLALRAASVLIILALLHAMYRFKSPLGPYLTFSGNDADPAVSSYQGIGRSIVAVAIFLAAVASKSGTRVVILMTGSILLILVGSRTDFFTLLALTCVTVGITVLRGRSLGLAVGLLLVCAVAYHFAAPLFLNTRNAEILDLASSSSWQARHELEYTALGVIRSNPLLGDFGYHWRIGGSGFYAHNALSAWTNYGMVGFLLYTGLIVYFTLVSFRRMLSSAIVDPVWFAAFQLNLAALIQALVAAPVFTPLPALGWGVALNAMRTRQVSRAPESAPLPELRTVTPSSFPLPTV